MRDTQQSFTSFNRSNLGDAQSPAINSGMRRSQRDFGQINTGASWNRQNSEARSKRPTDLASTSSMMNRHDTMQNTGQSWADRRADRLATGAQDGSMLPDISGN